MNIKQIVILGMLLALTNCINAQVFTNYTTATSGLPDDFVNGGVAIDQNNNKWFGTGSGVAKFDDVNWTVYTTTDGLIDNFTTCIAVDLNNNIWVGTNSGVSKFNGTTWTNYTTVNGLPIDAINDIKADAVGNVWFATYAGLSKFNGTTFTNYTTVEGLSVDLITNITTDALNNIWLGTLGGGISKFNGTTFTNFGSSSNIVDTNITAIMVDHNDNKWVGTFFGTSVFNNSNVWVSDYSVLDGLYGDYVRDIKEDSHGNIWFGIFVDYLFDGAITKFDGTNWTSYAVPQGLVDYQVKKLVIDQQDNIWIATGMGVSKFEDVTGITNVDSQISVSVYPNPASQFLNISLNKNASLFNQKIEIVNAVGQKIEEINLINNQNSTISLENYSEGIYLLKTAEGSTKFVVKK
jgi:ligand-binding sensor domain-containing protein